MNKKALIKEIAQANNFKKCNLDAFDKEQLEDLLECGEAVITLKQLRRIFKERNTKAAKNSELALKNSRQAAMIQKLEKELEEYKKGQDLYQIVKKSLVDMTYEERKTLGLFIGSDINNIIDLAHKKIDEAQYEANHAIEMHKKHG